MVKSVRVEQVVEVEIDEKKFDQKFMDEFREFFYDFETIEDHIKHLAQLEARGFIPSNDCFIEGYGKMSEMGISFRKDIREQRETVI